VSLCGRGWSWTVGPKVVTSHRSLVTLIYLYPVKSTSPADRQTDGRAWRRWR